MWCSVEVPLHLSSDIFWHLLLLASFLSAALFLKFGPESDTTFGSVTIPLAHWFEGLGWYSGSGDQTRSDRPWQIAVVSGCSDWAYLKAMAQFST